MNVRFVKRDDPPCRRARARFRAVEAYSRIGLKYRNPLARVRAGRGEPFSIVTTDAKGLKHVNRDASPRKSSGGAKRDTPVAAREFIPAGLPQQVVHPSHYWRESWKELLGLVYGQTPRLRCSG